MDAHDLSFFDTIEVPKPKTASDYVKVTIYIPKEAGGELVEIARTNGHRELPKYLGMVCGLAMQAKRAIWQAPVKKASSDHS